MQSCPNCLNLCPDSAPRCFYCEAPLSRAPGETAADSAERWSQRVSMPSPPAARREAKPGRRLVAVLVTYTWRKEGQFFPVYEGRNLIGLGDECDIRVPEDAALRPIHAIVAFQDSFFAGDIAGEGVEVNGVTLRRQIIGVANHSRIRTASTEWLLAIVDPALL